LYLGYLALRRTGATSDERGKRSAIAALIAFADVPVNYLSVTWWQTLHQQGTVFNKNLNVQNRRFDGVHAHPRGRRLHDALRLPRLERFQLAQLEEDARNASSSSRSRSGSAPSTRRSFRMIARRRLQARTFSRVARVIEGRRSEPHE